MCITRFARDIVMVISYLRHFRYFLVAQGSKQVLVINADCCLLLCSLRCIMAFHNLLRVLRVSVHLNKDSL